MVSGSRKPKQCVYIFVRERGLHPDPVLSLNDKTIPVVGHTKCLGVVFDSKLSFVPYMHYLRNKSIILLKVVAHKDWGGDSETVLRLYRSLIRSKLDYACIVYGSARRSYLSMLDPVQNQALRLCLGAFRNLPVDSLQVEANEIPLGHRRDRLAIQYLTKLKSTPSNPTYQCIFTPQFTRLFEEKQHMIAPFGVRMGCLISKMQLTITAV